MGRAAANLQNSTSTFRSSDRNRKFLTFHLGAEEYGIQVTKVREIMGIQQVTAVPHTPSYVKGVINLRGRVIPVLDLRRKLDLPDVEYTQSTCIIVVQLEVESNPVLTGVVVDGVSEVLTIANSDVEPPPDFGGAVAVQHLLGIAKVKDRVRVLLDIDLILGREGSRMEPVMHSLEMEQCG
jgi:purine-binding chemotaxis protein CheW